MKEPKPFKMPPALLKQLVECSDGGVLLSWIDTEGNVSIFQQCDSEAKFLAIIGKLSQFINAMNNLSSDMIADDVIENGEED